jgi:hypothetical protein
MGPLPSVPWSLHGRRTDGDSCNTTELCGELPSEPRREHLKTFVNREEIRAQGGTVSIRATKFRV